MDEGLRRREDWFFLELVFLFIVPPTMFYVLGTKNKTYLFVFAFALIILFSIIIREKITWRELGFTNKNFKKAFLPYLIFTLIGVWGIKFFAKEFGFDPFLNWQHNDLFLLLFVPISIFQEFAYRSFLIPGLKKVFTDPTTVVLVNAGLFAILHLFYPDHALVLPLAFAGGLGFATLFYIYPNIYLASIAHIILNFVAVTSGFFVISG